jgi:cytosine/adenosine deaminase-related metal-dependent hydrolase
LSVVLRAATATNRRHFGQGPGTLTVGTPFEAVLLAGSPWDDWQALHQPVRVWRAAV